MKRMSLLLLPSIIALSLLGLIWGVASIQAANTNADYSGVAPFVASAVTPNVLIMLDNSGSMGYRAVCDGTPNATVPYDDCPTASQIYPVGTPAGAPFIDTVDFSGLFSSLKCYNYDQGNKRFAATTAKGVLNTACGAADWDGNFLNWATFRRHDALKQALMGGQCAAARLADSSCPPSGAPALVTIKGEDGAMSACCANASTPPVPKGAGANNANGRVPTAIQGLVSTASLVLHLRGVGTLPSGGFCVGRSNAGPPTTGASICGIASSPTTPANGQFLIHLVVGTEPTGVIQQLGDKARFGLLEFRATGDGGKVLVPIGANQSVPYDLSTVTTHTSNKAAMVAGIEKSLPAVGTPLAETLYTGLRYIAQLSQPFSATGYLYPIAFGTSGGPAFQPSSSQKGSLGPSEQSVLAAAETCPAGYDIAKACGRDPYFFGSRPAPGWSATSKQVPCCKTFIMFLTDGEANQDSSIPAGLQDFAHAAHGPHCTGTYAGSPASNPSSVQYLGSSGCFSTTNPIAPAVLMEKHKTDYAGGILNHTVDDVAYWGHINDLRQAILPVTGEAGHDLPGFQNVTIYPVFAFGNINGRELLMQTAKQGGFEDQNGNKLPDLQSEWDKVDNSTGLLTPDGIPDTYFESQSANDIKDKLLAALTSVLQKSASGTSASVLASSATGEGAMYQAYFFPTTFNTVGPTTTEVLWTGYTQGLFVDFYGNLREDFSAPGCSGTPDGKLVLSHDCIIKLHLDTATGDVVVERYKDDNGDAITDAATPYQTVGLRDVQPIWEAGRRLALTDPDVTCPANTGGVTCRRILTYMDITNGGAVGPSVEEYNEFAPGRVSLLCPYLGGVLAINCNSANAVNKTNALNEATNIIKFVRGFQVGGLRDRQLNVKDDTGTPVTKVWKLGDIINSTPVVVAAPKERFDVLYGDAGYSSFFRRYKDRRQVAYTGANDGMLHAFNAGYFTVGDDTSTVGVKEQARFTTVPVQPGTSTACAGLPCDASVTQYGFRTNNPKLGSELWAFIPQDLLPQLRWLTMPGYDHTYYVDLTPKVTDARIFPNDADHPGGWGTVLIGGFRLGGSCTNCTQGKSGPRTVNADFDYDGTTTDTGNKTSGSDTRVFLSSYFVLDVTNPEKDPVLLWVFRDKDLGLTTAAPAILRVNPSGDGKTSSVNEKWYVVFGTGPTHIDGSSGQTAKMFVVDLKEGPQFTSINQTSGIVGGTTCSLTSPCIAADTISASNDVRVFSTGETGASMGNVISVDHQLDYRVDTMYAGTISCTTATNPCAGANPKWRGALYRLTTNGGNTDPDTWGFAGSPTKLISTFAYTTPQATTCANASPCFVGPVLSTPALSVDDAQNLWVYFGTGRFYSNDDKTGKDMQHFFGVKDCIITGSCTDQTVERNNLLNVSSVVVCTVCSGAQVTGVAGVTSFEGSAGTSLVGTIDTMDGWFTTLPTAGERNLFGGRILGGSIFFTSFVPTDDICAASGDGNLYALYYQTGTAYKESVIGTTPSGPDTLVNRSIELEIGMPSQMAIQIGAQGTGAAGSSGGAGSLGRVTGFIEGGSGATASLSIKPALSPFSRMISWRDL